MPPVVLRLHLLALTAVPLIALDRHAGSPALAAGELLLATITAGWRRRLRFAADDGAVGPMPSCQPAGSLLPAAAVNAAYCLTL